MLYSKSNALKRYLGLITLLILAQIGLGFVAPGLPPLIFGSCMVIWMIKNTCQYNEICCCSKKPAEDELAPPLLPNNSTQQPAAVKSERLFYLDNLKVFLTMMVIVHHLTCTFVGGGWIWNFNGSKSDENKIGLVGNWLLTTNQAYFMSMFFFISGYFTPTSYDRKGKVNFLKDKFKRLGIPYVVMCFVIYPVVMLSSFLIIDDVKSSDSTFSFNEVWWYSLIPNPTVLWFTGWLCIFNTVYASVDHSEHTVMACPKPLKFLCVYTPPLFILNLGLMVAGLGSFLYMPISWASLPFDVLCFFGGCIAKRNKWLESDTPGGLVEIMSNSWTRIWTYGIFIFACVGLLVFYLLQGFNDGVTALSAYIVIGLVFFVQLDFFRRHFNWTGRWSKILAQSAYTVYIIHPLFVNLWCWIFLKAYEGSNGSEDIIFIGTNLTSTSEFTSPDAQEWLFGGYVCANIGAIASTWFVAYWVREIPGFKKVL
ncbi:hypothetical protein TL16_g10170 [Triparma laevis f. inornata]|uniref:Acyltransferase 3 domain-containing protein n=1 Tax=Triparma laevis f. inornata TaxID=1714386 RepID=A0A9W7ELJ7_9STRA|nr:hypothetical protein TL16_g10170 [Triparma laevis f. inornata]